MMRLCLNQKEFDGTTESYPVANTRRFTNARKNECSSLVKLFKISHYIYTLSHTKASKLTYVGVANDQGNKNKHRNC